MKLENLITNNFGKATWKKVDKEIKNYSYNIKRNTIEMTPAFLFGLALTYVGQTISQDIWNSTIINSIVGYIAGLISAIPYFIHHFYSNQEKYSGKKNKGKKKQFMIDYMFADLIVDVFTYAPIFALFDQILQRTPQLQEEILGFSLKIGETGVVASIAAIPVYILAISAFMPVAVEISKRVRKKFQSKS
jgi:hypothetical protein